MKAHGIELTIGQVWGHKHSSEPTRITDLKPERRGVRGHDSGWWTLEDWASEHFGLVEEDPDMAPIKGIDATIDRIAPLPPNPKQAYGAQKPDLSLIPPVALAHAALAFENGAAKYGPFNWRERAVEARTYIAAAQRHLGDFLDRADRASDSDVHNLGHVIACCAILLDAIEQGNLIDNRPPAGKSAEVLERLKAWKVRRAAANLEAAREASEARKHIPTDPQGWT